MPTAKPFTQQAKGVIPCGIIRTNLAHNIINIFLRNLKIQSMNSWELKREKRISGKTPENKEYLQAEQEKIRNIICRGVIKNEYYTEN